MPRGCHVHFGCCINNNRKSALGDPVRRSFMASGKSTSKQFKNTGLLGDMLLGLFHLFKCLQTKSLLPLNYIHIVLFF